MFCRRHPIPHEDCLDCRTTVAAMRPTVFAELAAIELCAGTQECRDCGYVRYQAASHCPRCGDGHVVRTPHREAPGARPSAGGPAAVRR